MTSTRQKSDICGLFEQAVRHATRFRDAIPSRAPRSTASAEELHIAFSAPTPEEGSDPRQVLDNLVMAAEPGLMGMAGGRFFGWVIGASHPVGVAADWMASAWGQNAGNYHASPAAAMAEKESARWLLDILQLPSECSVGFVTGATMANFTCLAAARSEVLCRVGWDVENDGLTGAPPVTVFASADAHATVFNALQYLGLGRRRVILIETDENGRMDAGHLARELAKTAGPKIVVAQAGQINTGAFDPFEDIVSACRACGAWLHVDGAFGLWANCSPALTDMCRGIERADSWATDGHKWLQLPYDSGFAIVRHPHAHRRAMNIAASYLPKTEGPQYEPSQYVPELSRRARGFATWAVLKALGRTGIRSMVERHCRFATTLARRLSSVPGIHVENTVSLNQVIVSFGTSEDTQLRDRLTRDVIRYVQRRNRVFVEGGSWRGRWVLRVSVISCPTTEGDMDLLGTEIIASWQEVQRNEENTRLLSA